MYKTGNNSTSGWNILVFPTVLKRVKTGAKTVLRYQVRTPTSKGRKLSLKTKIQKIFELILYKTGNNSTSGWNFSIFSTVLKRAYTGAKTVLRHQRRTLTRKGRKLRWKTEIRVIFKYILYKTGNNSTSGWSFSNFLTVLKRPWWGAKSRLWSWRQTPTGKGPKLRLKTKIQKIFE